MKEDRNVSLPEGDKTTHTTRRQNLSAVAMLEDEVSSEETGGNKGKHRSLPKNKNDYNQPRVDRETIISPTDSSDVGRAKPEECHADIHA